MKFVTNRIYFGQPKSNKVAELLKSAGTKQEEGLTKTASAEKEAAFPAGHEEKFKANTEKLKAKVDGKKDEAKPCMDAAPKACADGKKAEVAVEKEIKVADTTKKAGELPTVKVEKEEGVEKYEAGKKEATEFTNDAEKKPEDAKKPEKEAGKAATTKTTTQDGTFPSTGQPQWEGKKENNNDPWKAEGKDPYKSAKAEELIKQVLASLEGPMQKTANMTSEVKKRTRAVLEVFWPSNYVDAILADK